jgi:hypothetical protein
MPARAFVSVAQSFKYTSSCFSDRHNRSTKMLSLQQPRPSVLMATWR